MNETEQRTIKSLICTKLGDPTSPDLAVLRVGQRPAVSPLPPASVRIRVSAASLNFADALQIQGLYQERPALPFVPGSECSGIVTEVGRDVRAFKPGDHVAAVTQNGAFAEEVTAHALGVIKLPVSCDIEAAAGLPVAYGTAMMCLKDRAQLKPGQTVLVFGAAGGVGLAAVQLSRVLGARVVAVARGKDKAEALKFAGADVVIDMHGRRPEELRGLVKKAAPEGVDVVFDPVGEPLSSEALRCIKWGGHFVIVGFASGKIPKLPANVALVKNLTVHGVYWGAHMQRNAKAFRKSLEEVGTLFANGDIAVNVSHRYALEDAREAFSVLMKRQVIGKLLIVPGPRSML